MTSTPHTDAELQALAAHERIWLEPGPGGHEGRTWCQDDVWDDEGTEYVRADLHDALLDRNAALQQRLEELEARTRECCEVIKDIAEPAKVDASVSVQVLWARAIAASRRARAALSGEER